MSAEATCEAVASLARIGFRHLLDPIDTPDGLDLDDESAVECWSHSAVRKRLLATAPTARPGKHGVRWIERITWPDRVPALKVWAGQLTLEKIIRTRQQAVHRADPGNLFELEVPMRGASGLDWRSAPSADEIGFSLDLHPEIETLQRPAIELLAIVGLETVPLVSFSHHAAGFIHGGVWRIEIEKRGGYYRRWGACSRWGTR